MNFHWKPPASNNLRKEACQKEKHIRSEIMTIFNVFHFIFGIFLIKRQEWKRGNIFFIFHHYMCRIGRPSVITGHIKKAEDEIMYIY